MPPDPIIASHYRIDPACPPAMLSGGLSCIGVIDLRNAARKLLAVQADRRLPPRPGMLPATRPLEIAHAMMPVDQGVGPALGGGPMERQAWFLICERPPGPALSASAQPWSEQELVACVLRPAAIALAAFQARGLTHRAIRPDNLFRSAPREHAVLGPCWAAPPASAQPCVCEPVYAAWCVPAGRGDGAIADDIYALGVTLLALLTGRAPLAELDDRSILRRKIELGSFAALTAGLALPPLLSDLLRGMLAEDPDHRPTPEILLSPERARTRRVAARPPRRAHAAIEIDGAAIWSARELAFAISQAPDSGAALIRGGGVDRWLRRDLGDSALALQLAEAAAIAQAASGDKRQSASLVMRTVAALDPLAPLVWRSLAVMPDGVGSALAAADPAAAAALEELIAEEATLQWSALNGRRGSTLLRHEARERATWLAMRGPAGGLRRVAYGANPLLPCASPRLGTAVVARLIDLLPALEAGAAQADRAHPPVDADIVAYIASKAELTILGELTSIANLAGAFERLTVLRVFAHMQDRLGPGPFPELCRWLVESGFTDIHRWRSRKLRAARKDALDEAAKSGRFDRLIDVIEDRAARRSDDLAAGNAEAEIRRLEAELAKMKDGASRRDAVAQRLGHEGVSFAGLVATLASVLAWAMS